MDEENQNDGREEEKKKHAKALSALGASKGGKARAQKLTSEKKREIAAKAARARWRTNPVRATHVGTLKIGDMEFACANLPDGRRVISEATMMRALARGYSGYYSQRDAAARPGSAVLPRYVSPAALRPFISKEVTDLLTAPIAYLQPEGATVSKGVDAEVLPQICEVWLKARGAGVLNDKQEATAAKAEIIVRGLATVGIIALIDEATGHQYERARNALEQILEKFISKELARWVKTFPDEYYGQIFRLRGWKRDPLDGKRPQVVGRWTSNIVYARLAPGVLDRLKEITPKDYKGRFKHKLFQRLSDDVGVRALREHLASVTTIMAIAPSWEWFMSKLDQRHPKFNTTLSLPFPEEDGTE